MANDYQSWGRYLAAHHTVRKVYWRTDPLAIGKTDRPVLPYGCGRSYGDSCQNHGGILLDTTPLNRFISFDPEWGRLSCEAGVTLGKILKLIVPRGLFLAVTPGTKFVTVGGAIANDVHGKNHHRSGTFGAHVLQLELLRSDSQRILCSPSRNPEWFKATIGGLGLTGLITWAEIRLKRVSNPFLMVERFPFSSLDEFFELSAASDQDWEYTVAWVDTLAKGKALGRGIFFRGNHAEFIPGRQPSPRDMGIRIPFDAPSVLLNRAAVRVFNLLYFHKQRQSASSRVVHYNPFFYPLDAIGEWNRLYGRRGFFQYQCVVPRASGDGAVRTILETVAISGLGSFLSVMKICGDAISPGMLSFPRKGVTLALDFPNNGSVTLALMDRLDEIVRKAGGAVYPAKDARMSAESFQVFYPQWKEFARYIDPRFSSSFWRRVTALPPGE